MQYTIRDVPPAVDEALRLRAEETGRSLNETAIQALADDAGVSHYAAVFKQLRAQDTPIPTNDMWLAALVLQHNLALHDRDAHFDHLPQLVRV